MDVELQLINIKTLSNQNGIYAPFISFWYMILYSLCPTILMFLFGCLTLYNLRQRRQRRQIVPITNENNQIIRRLDIQLLTRLTSQVFVVAITTSPFSICRLHLAFTENITKDTLRLGTRKPSG